MAAHPVLYRALIEPLTVAALNTPGHEASSARLGVVLRRLGRPGAGALLVAREGLGPDLIAPALRTLEQAGATIRFGARLRAMTEAEGRIIALHFGDDSIIRSLYEWPSFAPFIQEVLEEPSFYRYADPLADVVINLAEEGNGFPWHFDTNNYTVTLAIQNAEHGGEFEFSPNLRTPTDENYDGVGQVLDGDQTLIHTLHLEPGDLQIFKGRYSLHRVTPLSGPTMRYVAIFSFTEMEGVVGSPERTKQLYGRVLPIHLERAGMRGDALVD